MKQFSSQSIIALKDALKSIYWRKKDLKDFIYHTITNKVMVSTLDFETATKGETVSNLIDRMLARQDLYHDDLLKLFDAVINFNDFSHLSIWENGEEKIKDAKRAVEALRKQAEGYFEKLEAERRAAERKRTFQIMQEERAATRVKIEGLKNSFQFMVTKPAQERGYAFERFLNDLFEYYELDPRRSFKISGEQIDGAFTFESMDYLVEAKWQDKPIDAGDLHKFSGKISGKFKATLGLYISFNGYSAESLTTGAPGIKSMILMDGQDLMCVLDNRIELPDLLYRKRRHAAETGDVYLKAADIL